MTIQLPISKSLANRMLIRQAFLNLPLLPVDPAVDPDDVVLLHDALLALQHGEQRLYLKNCGTAMRFLTAFCAQKESLYVILEGCDRMYERPIAQLVDMLLELGADIRYLGREGFPPLEIRGRALRRDEAAVCVRPRSTQYISALMLCDLPVNTDMISPYIEMTRAVVNGYDKLERDWSSAAFWYERYALGLCPLPEFPALELPSLQGDSVAPQIFEAIMRRPKVFACDFTEIPDMYPAVAITCEQLGIELHASGVETLRIKESDRIRAIQEHKTYGDHRIAMALLAADLPCDDMACIAKSYPQFYNQLCESRR